jgi:hypothetical protein
LWERSAVRERNRSSDAREWVEEKISTVAARRALPPPELPQPKPKRYVLSADIAHAQRSPPELPPAGTPRQEWDAAVAAVRAGSAPSSIAKGSDVPNDFVLRVTGLAP